MSETWLKVPLNTKLMPQMEQMARERQLSLQRWCSEILMDAVGMERLRKAPPSGGNPVLPGNKRT